MPSFRLLKGEGVSVNRGVPLLGGPFKRCLFESILFWGNTRAVKGFFNKVPRIHESNFKSMQPLQLQGSGVWGGLGSDFRV